MHLLPRIELSPARAARLGRGRGPWTARSQDLAVALLFLAVPVAMVVMALGFGDQARRLPQVVGVPCIILAAINVVMILMGRSGSSSPPSDGHLTQPFDGKVDAVGSVHAPREDGALDQDAETEWEPGGPLILVFGALAALTGLFYLFGMLVTAAVFTGLCMKFRGGSTWRNTLFFVSMLTLSFWVMAEYLGAPLNKGVLGLITSTRLIAVHLV
jgi:hypothetical protein